jgi:integrase
MRRAGRSIRATLRRDKALKLPLPPSPGRPYSADEKARMLEEALKLRTPQMRAALALDLNTGLRDKELREIRWEQIDLIHEKALTVASRKARPARGGWREAARPRRNRRTPARSRRETPAGSRTATAGCGGPPIGSGSVITGGGHGQFLNDLKLQEQALLSPGVAISPPAG